MAPFAFHQEYIGYGGGLILSLCLTPQIIKALKRKHTADISFIWQFMYIIGLSGCVTYSYLAHVYPIAIPMSLELTLCVILTLIKFKYDIIDKKWRKKQSKPHHLHQHDIITSLIPDDHTNIITNEFKNVVSYDSINNK